MKIFNEEILKNNFIDFSLDNSSIVIDDTYYNNIYTIIVSYYNNKYSIKGFNLFENTVFDICKNSIEYIDLIEIKLNHYKLYIYN